MTLPFEDYAVFHRLALETHDVDPTYPVIREIGRPADAESRLWLTFLHVAYYHLGSALKAWARYPNPSAIADDYLKLPCATERRGHRDTRRLDVHIRSLLEKAEQHGSLSAWISQGLPDNPVNAWTDLTDRIMSVWGNGRWAAYKTCELLWKVNGLRIQASDMGHAHSSGPRQGLALVVDNIPTGNSKADVHELDMISMTVMDRLRVMGLVADVEEVETTLCDFHALADGRYYVGHDIDQMLAQLIDVRSGLTESALLARAATLPHAYLGELNGWRGVQQDRKRLYRDRRIIISRE